MKQIGINLAEVALLLTALFLTLPYIPSHEMDQLPLFPQAIFAVLCFAGSRWIRWRPKRLLAFAETAAFFLFVWASNAAANLLYTY